MPSPPRRPLPWTLLFACYPLAAGMMLLFAALPQLAPGGDDNPPGPAVRAVFFGVAAIGAGIGVAAFRRARITPALAFAVHALVAAVALAGIGSRILGTPWFDGGHGELAAKAAVHLALAALWRGRALRRWFAAVAA